MKTFLSLARVVLPSTLLWSGTCLVHNIVVTPSPGGYRAQKFISFSCVPSTLEDITNDSVEIHPPCSGTYEVKKEDFPGLHNDILSKIVTGPPLAKMLAWKLGNIQPTILKESG